MLKSSKQFVKYKMLNILKITIFNTILFMPNLIAIPDPSNHPSATARAKLVEQSYTAHGSKFNIYSLKVPRYGDTHR